MPTEKNGATAFHILPANLDRFSERTALHRKNQYEIQQRTIAKTERSSICETAKLPTERLCWRTFCKRMLKPIICCPIPMRIRWTRNRKAVCLHPVRPGGRICAIGIKRGGGKHAGYRPVSEGRACGIRPQSQGIPFQNVWIPADRFHAAGAVVGKD